MAEITNVIKRVSLLSFEVEEATEKQKKISKSSVPPDKFYFTHILCIFLGQAMLLPLVFFINANDYWMYKFRDTSPSAIDDADHRTKMQSNFASVQAVTQAVACIICNYLAAIYGHKLLIKTRFLLSLSSVLICFVILTTFVKVNTDTWQVEFFILTMGLFVITIGITQLFQVTCMVVVSKFPEEYMNSFIYGQSVSSIASAVLQIIALAIGGSSESAALNYFVAGSFLIGLTLLLSFLSQYSAFYQHFCVDAPKTIKKKPYSIKEIKETVALVWPCLFMLILFILSVITAHPTITSLIVSEYSKTGTEWNKKYFVPVVTFLFSSVMDLLGRYGQNFLPKMSKTNAKYFVFFAIAKSIILSPMIWFCNAKPRQHLPVLFNHDWQYIIIIGIYSITNGYFLMAAITGVTVLGEDRKELSYILTQVSLGIIGSLLSPLSIVIVNSL